MTYTFQILFHILVNSNTGLGFFNVCLVAVLWIVGVFETIFKAIELHKLKH